MPISIESTSSYPVRYDAFERPGIIFRSTHIPTCEQGGREYIVGHWPMPNQRNPEISDGLWIEVISYQGMDWLIRCHFTCPNWHREQIGIDTIFESLNLACDFAAEWAEEMLDIWKEYSTASMQTACNLMKLASGRRKS